MKTNKIFMLAIAAGAMFLGSCSNDDELKQIDEAAKPGTMVFTATMENAGDATRTVLNGNNVNWVNDDQIIISKGTAEGTFSAFNSSGTTCQFSGSIAESTGSTYYAVYPSSAVTTTAGGSSTENYITLPDVQTAVAGSYDPSAAVMLAKSTTKDLAFKNLNCLVKVTPQFDCSKIILEANGSQIAGKVKVTWTADATPIPSWSATGTSSDVKDSVTLNPSDGSYIQGGQTYYIAVLPTTTSDNGIKITFIATESDDNGNLGFVKTKSAAVNFYRNQILNFGNIAKSNCNAVKLLKVYGYAEDYQPNVNAAFVDLGIESNGKMLGWATKNVNASDAKPYGDYYAWGEIEPYYDSYTMSGTTVNATFSGVKAYTSAYYNTQAAASITSNLSGATQDVATAIMGTNWRMPTVTELGYLANECVWVYTTLTHNGLSTAGYKIFRAKDPAHAGYCYAIADNTHMGVSGYQWMKSQNSNYSWQCDVDASIPSVASASLSTTLSNEYLTKTDGYIFLPCTGAFNGSGGAFQYGGCLGYYWTSSWSYSTNARFMHFRSYFLYPQYNSNRCNGYAVRGVCQ